jgi:hypothetical protein
MSPVKPDSGSVHVSGVGHREGVVDEDGHVPRVAVGLREPDGHVGAAAVGRGGETRRRQEDGDAGNVAVGVGLLRQLPGGVDVGVARDAGLVLDVQQAVVRAPRDRRGEHPRRDIHVVILVEDVGEVVLGPVHHPQVAGADAVVVPADLERERPLHVFDAPLGGTHPAEAHLARLVMAERPVVGPVRHLLDRVLVLGREVGAGDEMLFRELDLRDGDVRPLDAVVGDVDRALEVRGRLAGGGVAGQRLA